MAQITISKFREDFPEFNDDFPVPAGQDENPVVEKARETALALQRTGVEAQGWLIAHLLALFNSETAEERAKADGGRGEVVSETIGPLMRMYRTQAGLEGGDDVFYTPTRYGRTYLQVRRRMPSYAFGRLFAR